MPYTTLSSQDMVYTLILILGDGSSVLSMNQLDSRREVPEFVDHSLLHLMVFKGDADFIAHMFHLRRPMDIQNSFVISDFVFEISLTFANSCLICLVLIHQLRKLQAYWMLLSLWCIGSGSWWWWWKTAIHSLGCWCPLPPKAPCLHILQTTRIHGAHGMMSIQCPARLTTVDEFVDECASSPICDVVGFDSWRTLKLTSLHYFFRCVTLCLLYIFFLLFVHCRNLPWFASHLWLGFVSGSLWLSVYSMDRRPANFPRIIPWCSAAGFVQGLSQLVHSK